MFDCTCVIKTWKALMYCNFTVYMATMIYNQLCTFEPNIHICEFGNIKL